MLVSLKSSHAIQSQQEKKPVIPSKLLWMGTEGLEVYAGTTLGFRMAAKRGPDPGTGVCTRRKGAVCVTGDGGGGVCLWMVASFTCQPPHLGLGIQAENRPDLLTDLLR